MIIPPHILSKIKREPFLSNASFCSKSPFQVTPKAFKAIYVISLAIGIFTFTMFYQSVDIAFGSNTCVALPGIRAHGGTPLHSLFYKGNKRICFHVLDNLCPDLSTPAQDTKNRGLLGSSASFYDPYSLCFPFVFPLPSQVGFIHFYGTTDTAGMSWVITFLTKSKALKTLFRSRPVSAAISWLDNP